MILIKGSQFHRGIQIFKSIYCYTKITPPQKDSVVNIDFLVCAIRNLLETYDL